jgi:hypothetical protein
MPSFEAAVNSSVARFSMMRRSVLMALVGGMLAMGAVRVEAQTPTQTPAQTPGAPDDALSKTTLFETIKAQDAALFQAYNTCDLKTLGAMVTEDLEFYHDLTGLAVGRQVFVDAIKNNICGKVTRELVASSLEVYPLKGYGAVEMGVHRFHHPGTEDKNGVGEARFVQLWQWKDGVWRVSRVISYEHRAAKEK